MKLTQQVTKEESTDVLSEKELNAAELTIKFKNLVKEKVKSEVFPSKRYKGSKFSLRVD